MRSLENVFIVFLNLFFLESFVLALILKVWVLEPRSGLCFRFFIKKYNSLNMLWSEDFISTETGMSFPI